jgi:hypothetical protein
MNPTDQLSPPAPGEAPGMDGLPELNEPQAPEAEVPDLVMPDNVAEFMEFYTRDVKVQIKEEHDSIADEIRGVAEDLPDDQMIDDAEGVITVTQLIEDGEAVETEVDGGVTKLSIVDREQDDFALWESEIGEPDDLEQDKDRDLEEEPKSDILNAEISEEMWAEIDQLDQEATERKAKEVASDVIKAEIGKLVVSGEVDQDERELAEEMLSSERVEAAIDKVSEDYSEAAVVGSEDQGSQPEAIEDVVSDEKKLADLEAELKDDFRQHVLELVQSIEAGQEVVETDLGELSEASIGAMVYIESAVEAADNPEDKIDAVLDTTQEAAEALSEYEDEGIKASKQIIAYAADRISSIIAEAEKAMIADAEAQKAALAEAASSTANLQFAAVAQ